MSSQHGVNSNPPTPASINEILEGEVLKMIGMWLKNGEWDEQPHKIVRKTAQAQKHALYTLIESVRPEKKSDNPVDYELGVGFDASDVSAPIDKFGFELKTRKGNHA